MTNRAKWVAMFAILTIVTGGLAEVGLRALQYVRDGTSPLTLLPGYRERRFVMSPFLVFGPRLDYQIAGKPSPDTAYFNAQGFRMRGELGRKAPGELRIVAIGGSTTEEVWNEEGLHWPLLTERELRAAGFDHVRIYNTGMSAYSSAHTLVRLAFDVMDYQPDVVIVMDNINDLTVNYWAAQDGQRTDPHYRAAFVRKYYTNELDTSDIVISRVARAISARVSAALDTERAVPNAYSIAEGMTFFERNLRNIQVLVESRGAMLVLLTMPACRSEQVYRTVEVQGRRRFSAPLPASFQHFTRDFAAYNDAIRRVAASRGIAMVDMNRLFGDDEQFFSDFVHYNAAGSRRFASILGDQVKPLLAKFAGPPGAASSSPATGSQ